MKTQYTSSTDSLEIETVSRNIMLFDATERRRSRLREHALKTPDAPAPWEEPIAPVPPPVAPEPPVAAPEPKELETFLINFVVEQTGYPEEMVEMDANLEADLGIDSIKKAQLFGELGEYFDLKVSSDLTLDDFPTLRHVLNFIAQNSVAQNDGVQTEAPAPVSQPAPEPVAAAPATSSLNPKELETFLVNFVVEQTGYPEEMVEMDANLEADLGIDSIKKAQLFGELGEYFDLKVSSDLTLDDFPTLRHVLDFIAQNSVTQNDVAPAEISVSQPTPEHVAAASTTSSLNPKELETFLVNFVVEQTGYPEEMVEMDANLEADLGIDSIKKAQLFGELGEYFDLKVSSDLTLDDFPTLRHVLNFIAQNNVAQNETPVSQPAPEPVAAAPAATSLNPKELETFLVNFVVEQTGYPEEMVELDANLEADLGIDSIKKAQLFGELGEYFDLKVSSDLTLDDFPTLRHVLAFITQNGVAQSSLSV